MLARLLALAMITSALASSWHQVAEHAPWAPRAAPHGAVVNGQFTVCAGRQHYTTFFNDCWRSQDGANWTQLPDAPWSKRAYPEIVPLANGTLLMFGGEDGFVGFGFENDVWRSDTGGESWWKVIDHAPWRGRAGHKGFVVGDEVWMVGGGVRTLARKLLNDVWVTKDLGVTWEQRTAEAEWSPRAGMEIAVIGTDVLLMGGDHDVPVFSSAGPNHNDIWKTSDGGRTWHLIANAGWSRRTGHKCTTLNAFIYCVGGAHQNGTTYLQHDVWRSADGEQWEQISDDAWGCAPAAGSCGKDDMLLLERDGALWTFGGDEETGKGGGQDNSVWKFTI
eukprot:TRINITY_DN355_c0_g1_i1.p1 TRINITY_DN355_c0_g1~~TRINITY_DN355_c0_g1_i1.p1  ORF type:complete len:334 (+),score=39.18 TRINITY_DN355_c0_g1_i1:152-1153(+)